MNGVGIEVSIVLTGAKATIFLWDEEKGGCLR